MRSRFKEVERGQFIITLIPESLADVDFLGLYNDKDIEQNSILHSYFIQSIKRQFANEPYIAYLRPDTEYPKSIFATIRFPIQKKKNAVC